MASVFTCRQSGKELATMPALVSAAGHTSSHRREPHMGMLIATTERVAGYEVQETLGEVFGIAVRSRGLVGNLLAGLKTIIGGEIHQYTAMLQTARQHAIERMVAEAQLKGADAVIMMRFDSGEIAQGITEIVAYGTAAKLRRTT
jgi:uncharacterized protein YbjQ (UPF0145 family)